MQIGVFLGEGFEETEALAPVDLLKRAGHNVLTVSVSHSHHVMGAHSVMVKADFCIDEVHMDNFEMLILPGGGGYKNLEKCDALMRKVKKFNEKGKYIAAICAAPTILGRLGVLADKKATCFPGMEADLFDAQYTGAEAEWCGNIITGRSAGCAIPFALRIIEAIDGKAAAEKMAKTIYYDYYKSQE